jgi:hypothetical protein
MAPGAASSDQESFNIRAFQGDAHAGLRLRHLVVEFKVPREARSTMTDFVIDASH